MSESVLINEPGTFVGKKSRRVIVKSNSGSIQEYSLLLLKEINIVGGGISISSDLLLQAAKLGVQINILDSLQRFQAVLIPPYLSETITNARAQIKSENTAKSFTLSRDILMSKINHQAQVLVEFLKENTLAENKNKILKIIEKLTIKQSELASRTFTVNYQKNLFALEGRAADYYWIGFKMCLGNDLLFAGRIGRGAKDPVNGLLNYGYAILYSRVLRSILKSGLMPFAGFMHADRPGKASLVLDIMEIFRQPIIDWTVIQFVRQEHPDASKELSTDIVRNFAKHLETRFQDRSIFTTKQYSLQKIIELQTDMIASFLKGERLLEIWNISKN